MLAGVVAAGCIVTNEHKSPVVLPRPTAPSAVALNDAAPPPVPSDSTTAAPALTSDEGMWLLNDFPSQLLQEYHGFGPSKEWLEHVQQAAVRLAGGCSGGFVSNHGLVMTNHHCASDCVQQLSTAKRDYARRGFSAAFETDEVRCPEIEVNELLIINDVTDRVNNATRGRTGAEYHDASEAEQSKIEKECAISDDLRCDVVNLYRGGLYQLYKYRRFQDVRLVFAPEYATAFFGGDPDNFMFPRYDLDVAFLRVYSDGKPLAPSDYFRWSPSGAKEGDLTFVAGHPGHSSRELTVAQLEALRDHSLPDRLMYLAEARGLLTEFQRRGVEQKRISIHLLFGIENSLKALKGRAEALRTFDIFTAKVAAEKDLRARVDANATLKPIVSQAWDGIAGAERKFDTIRVPYQMLEQGRGFWSELFEHARRLLRITSESTKPNEQRLHEYTDAQKPLYTRQVLSSAPIYNELEILTLTHSLTKLREALGPDAMIVSRLLGKENPFELATRLVLGSHLKKVKLRKALLEGGKTAVERVARPNDRACAPSRS